MSRTETPNIVKIKIPILYSLIYKANASLVKTPVILFCRYGEAHSKTYGKAETTEWLNIILKKNKLKGIILPKVKTYCMLKTI